VKRLLGKTDRLSRKTEPELGKTEIELEKMEPSSDKEKLVLGDANQLSGNVDRLLVKADSGTESGSGKVELGPGCEAGLWEE
jgi:hypothetical protein